ncbi:hypothetical protein PM082_017555 [Marasmius tenuissimus]|nr:hypothetical protein PM082_017555 [Marasmius tenuissimus]
MTSSHLPDTQQSIGKEACLPFDVGFRKGNPGDAPVSRWCQKLSGNAIKIDKLQVWKSNRNETLTHRFMVFHMFNGTVHRLDRSATAQADPFILSGLSFRVVGQVATTDEMQVDVNLKELKKRNELEIVVGREAGPKLYQGILSRINIPEKSHDQLWVDGSVREIIRAEVRVVLKDLMWPAIVDVITQGLGSNIDSASVIARNVFQGKSRRIVGRRTVQLWAMQNAALHGGLRAVKIAAQEKTTAVKAEAEAKTPDVAEQLKSLNEGMFDLVWDSARGGALEYAKDAVESTRDLLDPKHHVPTDAKWNTIWKVWDECWMKACKDARKRALDRIDVAVDAILDASVKVMLEELGSGSSQPTAVVQETKKFTIFGVELNSVCPRMFLVEPLDEFSCL